MNAEERRSALAQQLSATSSWWPTSLGSEKCADLARALAPLVERWIAEADNDARLSEIQGKADSLTGQLIIEQARRDGAAAERERIAQAIETDPSVRLGHNVSVVCSCLRCEVAHAAARIARTEPTP